MVNVAALQEIIPVLRELEAQERFYMDSWAAGIVNPNAHTYTECGTQFCMAGAKAVYDGWRPQYRSMRVWDPKRHAVVKAPVATGMFVTPENRHYDGTSPATARAAEDIAREAFDLNYTQANFLFYATHITRVDDLVRRIQWVCDHPDESDPDEAGEDGFPGCWLDEEHEHNEADRDRRERLHAKADPSEQDWWPSEALDYDGPVVPVETLAD